MNRSGAWREGRSSGILPGMTDRRIKNSELRLMRLEEEEANREEPEGILELFERDEDAPLTRDADDDAE